MNPFSKEGFHILIVLFKVLPTLLSIIFGLRWNPSKTLCLGKIIIIQTKDPYSSLVVPYLNHRIHTFFILASPLLLFFFSLFLSPLSLYGLVSQKLRDQLILSPFCIKAMFVLQIKPILVLTFHFFAFRSLGSYLFAINLCHILI